MWPVCRHESGHPARRTTANAVIRVPAMIMRKARYVNGSAYGNPYRAPMNPVLQMNTKTSGAACTNSGCSAVDAVLVPIGRAGEALVAMRAPRHDCEGCALDHSGTSP